MDRVITNIIAAIGVSLILSGVVMAQEPREPSFEEKLQLLTAVIRTELPALDEAQKAKLKAELLALAAECG